MSVSPATACLRRGLLLDLAAGALVILILVSFTLASRLAYAAALAPADLLAIRVGTSGLLLLPFALRLGMPTLLGWDSVRLALAGGIGFASVAFAGLALVPASHGGALMHGALPFFTFVIGVALGRAPAERRRILGALLVVAALAIVAWDGARGGGARQLLGDALVLAASAIWSSFGLLAARLGREPIGIAATIGVLSAAAYLPVYLVVLDPRLGDATPATILLQVAIQGVLVGTASPFAYSWAVSRLGALGTAVATSTVPAVTALSAIPILAEYPSAPVAVGLVILAAGSLLVLGIRAPARASTGRAGEAPAGQVRRRRSVSAELHREQ